jgi:hypothetical protein
MAAAPVLLRRKGMPEGFMLIDGADLLTALLLFAILIRAGLMRRLEKDALERQVRARRVSWDAPVPVAVPAAHSTTRVRPRNAA